MRRLRYAVIPLALAAVLGVGLFAGAGAQDEERDDQYWIDHYVNNVGLSVDHAAVLVWLREDIEAEIEFTLQLIDGSFESLRAGVVEDWASPNPFRGPSLADLEAQIEEIAATVDRLSNLPMAQCMP